MASRRFASRATRDLHLEQLVSPFPELGLVAANGPNDPEPELGVEGGAVTRMTVAPPRQVYSSRRGRSKWGAPAPRRKI